MAELYPNSVTSRLQNADANALGQEAIFNPPCDLAVPQWFAAYTVANHEKKVARQLADRAIAHYLPLYESVRQWKDRKVRLELPLFPGYVFVEIAARDRIKVVQIPGLVRLVGFGGQPTALPESDVAAIRMCLEHVERIEPHPVISVGERVRIVRGALAGMEGVLARRKGISRLVLCINLIMRAVAIEVDDADVEPVQHSSAMHGSRLTAATPELAVRPA